MTDTKPTFTVMTTHAFLWFVECYEKTVQIAETSRSLVRIPTFAEHFLKHYGLTDPEVSKETDQQKQLNMIQKKYVKG